MDYPLLVGIFPQVLLDGIILGFMYALIALGYTMVYGVLEFINFAHSEIFIVGAFVGVEILLSLKGAGLLETLPWPLVLVLILVAGGRRGLPGLVQRHGGGVERQTERVGTERIVDSGVVRLRGEVDRPAACTGAIQTTRLGIGILGREQSELEVDDGLRQRIAGWRGRLGMTGGGIDRLMREDILWEQSSQRAEAFFRQYHSIEAIVGQRVASRNPQLAMPPP